MTHDPSLTTTDRREQVEYYTADIAEARECLVHLERNWRVLPLLVVALTLFTACTPTTIVTEPPPAQVCFTPGEDCTGLIVRLLNEANQEILVHAYTFTSAPIAKALVQAHRRGVAVTVILDRSHRSNKYSEADLLAHMGVATFIDRRHAIAHNKIVLIDRQIVLTGSFNYTRAAQEKNAENLIVLRGDQKLLQRYLENFELHKRHGERYQGK